MFKLGADDGTLRSHLPRGATVQIDCAYGDGTDILLEFLEADHSGLSYGKTWNLAKGFQVKLIATLGRLTDKTSVAHQYRSIVLAAGADEVLRLF